MYKTWTVITTLFLLASHPLLAQSEKKSPYVFQIQCNSDGKIESQTGFSVADGKGIITALHGVIKCLNGKISAVAKGGGESMFDLKIESADIANDVALLSSTGSKIDNGLAIAKCDSNSCINYKEQFYVLGHPLGIISQMSKKVSVDKVIPLENYLTAVETKVKTEMEKRLSPDIKIQVFNVEGHLLHGHSGAPIINEKNEVIGVVNGGLKDGAVEIAWAIPWRNIKWRNRLEIVSQLDNLKSQSIPGPLTFFGSSSSDVLNLKISLVSPSGAEIAMSQTVFEDHSASYRLPISQSNSLENIQQVVIGTDNEVLAHGKLNTLLSSSDGQYQFAVSNDGGVWILSFFRPLVGYVWNFETNKSEESGLAEAITEEFKEQFFNLSLPCFKLIDLSNDDEDQLYGDRTPEKKIRSIRDLSPSDKNILVNGQVNTVIWGSVEDDKQECEFKISVKIESLNPTEGILARSNERLPRDKKFDHSTREKFLKELAKNLLSSPSLLHSLESCVNSSVSDKLPPKNPTSTYPPIITTTTNTSVVEGKTDVTWYDAEVHCESLGKRLLTSSEWLKSVTTPPQNPQVTHEWTATEFKYGQMVTCAYAVLGKEQCSSYKSKDGKGTHLTFRCSP